MKYGLHVITADEKTIDKLQTKMVKAILPAMGFNRNIAKGLLYGTYESGGQGFANLHTLLGSTKVNHILQHLQMPRRTGQTLLIYLQWIQLTAGTSIPVLDDAKKLHHLEDPCIKTVHDFLNITNSSIVIEGIKTPRSRREHDQNIMDTVLDSKRWDEHKTKIINYWRLYLQVETVADMSNGITNINNDIVMAYTRTTTQRGSTKNMAKFY